jgi:hypothetical protein
VDSGSVTEASWCLHVIVLDVGSHFGNPRHAQTDTPPPLTVTSAAICFPTITTLCPLFGDSQRHANAANLLTTRQGEGGPQSSVLSFGTHAASQRAGVSAPLPPFQVQTKPFHRFLVATAAVPSHCLITPARRESRRSGSMKTCGHVGSKL